MIPNKNIAYTNVKGAKYAAAQFQSGDASNVNILRRCRSVKCQPTQFPTTLLCLLHNKAQNSQEQNHPEYIY